LHAKVGHCQAIYTALRNEAATAPLCE
jgi:hypothetical protein